MVAEDLLDRGRLGRVAERGRRAVGVDVADLAPARSPTRSSARAHHLGNTHRIRIGLREVVRVVRDRRSRGPRHRRVAPRRSAASSSSSTSTHAPSAHHEAVAGRVEGTRGVAAGTRPRPRAPASAQKPARISGWRQASAPPARTASASPRLISSAASPTASRPSRRPRPARSSGRGSRATIASWPLAVSTSTFGRKCRRHRGQARARAALSCCSMIPRKPPIAVPNEDRRRGPPSRRPSSAASATASRAAPSERRTLRSSLRASLARRPGSGRSPSPPPRSARGTRSRRTSG